MTGKPWRPSLTAEERQRTEEFERESAERWAARGIELGPSHFDRDGQPISFVDWTDASCDDKYRRIGLDIIGDYEISTVWIGIYYAFPGTTGTPLPCETIVFILVDGARAHSSEAMKWPNADAARAGHDQFVAAAKRRKLKVERGRIETDDG